MKKHNTAFTLVEIMIVVAVIALLATLGTIGYMRARQVHNETMVKKSLKAIYEGVQSYWLMNDKYPEQLVYLGPDCCSPSYIDAQLASGEKNGYVFTYDGTLQNDWSCIAMPKSGERPYKQFEIRSNGAIEESIVE